MKINFYPKLDIFHILAMFTKITLAPRFRPGPGTARLRIPARAWPGSGSRRRLGIPAPGRDPGAGSGSRRRLGNPAPARDTGAGSGSRRRSGIPAQAWPGRLGIPAQRCAAPRNAAQRCAAQHIHVQQLATRVCCVTPPGSAPSTLKNTFRWESLIFMEMDVN